MMNTTHLKHELLAVFLFLENAQGSVERDKGEGSKEDKTNECVFPCLVE
jgi:hypothetical protein